jgi:hypothetical protein
VVSTLNLAPLTVNPRDLFSSTQKGFFVRYKNELSEGNKNTKKRLPFPAKPEEPLLKSAD